MSDLEPAARARAAERVTRAGWLRLSAALLALAAGISALVIAIYLIRSALS